MLFQLLWQLFPLVLVCLCAIWKRKGNIFRTDFVVGRFCDGIRETYADLFLAAPNDADEHVPAFYIGIPAVDFPTDFAFSRFMVFASYRRLARLDCNLYPQNRRIFSKRRPEADSTSGRTISLFSLCKIASSLNVYKTSPQWRHLTLPSDMRNDKHGDKGRTPAFKVIPNPCSSRRCTTSMQRTSVLRWTLALFGRQWIPWRHSRRDKLRSMLEERDAEVWSACCGME